MRSQTTSKGAALARPDPVTSSSVCRQSSEQHRAVPSGAEINRLVAAFRRDPGREFVTLGHALLALSKPEYALRVGSRGLREVPTSTEGRLMIGRALLALGRHAEAEEQLRWVVACSPSDARARSSLREALAQQARCAPSAQSADAAIEIADDSDCESDDEPTLVHRRGRILRFTRSERLLHWSFALPFLVCLATASLLVFYYNPHPTRPHRAIVSWVHRGSGVCFVTLPLLVLLLSVRSWRVHLENLMEGAVWRWSDFKWLALMPFAILSRRVRLPEEGKFNAGEKLNFTWTVLSMPLYAVTGFAIWFGTGVDVLPWLAHIGLAAVSVPLIAGHVFMAVINPGSRKGLSGMFSGWVERRWAAHHYRRWFRDKFGRYRTETGGALLATGRSHTLLIVAVVLLGLGGAGAAGYKLWLEPAAAAGANDATRYLAGDSPLWQEASEGATPLSGGPLVRAEQVVLLHTAGEFALVRDCRGREGYLFFVDLLKERPAFARESPPPQSGGCFAEAQR